MDAAAGLQVIIRAARFGKIAIVPEFALAIRPISGRVPLIFKCQWSNGPIA